MVITTEKIRVIKSIINLLNQLNNGRTFPKLNQIFLINHKEILNWTTAMSICKGYNKFTARRHFYYEYIRSECYSIRFVKSAFYALVSLKSRHCLDYLFIIFRKVVPKRTFDLTKFIKGISLKMIFQISVWHLE